MTANSRRRSFTSLAATCAAALVVAAGTVFAAQSNSTQPAPQSAVTFTKDIAPILFRSCVVCHRPGSVAPMSLLTYEDARPWARSIRQKVSTREMPPWYIERNVGIQKFKDDRSLTDAEISTITRWIDGGAPRGSPTDLPAAPKFAAAND